MKLHLFKLPALAPDAAQEAQNRRLASHRASYTQRRFIADGAASRP